MNTTGNILSTENNLRDAEKFEKMQETTNENHR